MASTINSNGTGLQGYWKGTKAMLMDVLGEPDYRPGERDKVQYEWVRRSHGVIFTVYDYKEQEPVENHKNIVWHIGGKRHDALILFANLITNPRIPGAGLNNDPYYFNQSKNSYQAVKITRPEGI
jgi:hypothetical protein